MPTVQLSDRSLITIDGPDAEHFLQNILTTDLDALAADLDAGQITEWGDLAGLPGLRALMPRQGGAAG